MTYNTATSGQGDAPSLPRSGMDVVLEAIGNEARSGIVRPIDVLALQEQQSSSTSVAAFVSLLNTIYGAGTYARSQVDANTLGGGRVGLVYNTQTVQLINSVPVGSVSGSGASRQPMRYQLRPVGYTSEADLYLYVHHYNATDPNRRNVEAQMTRTNADILGDGARIIYSGDYNIQSSTEPMYQTLLAPGNGQAFDPINVSGTWHNNGSVRFVHTQSPYNTAFNDPTLVAGGMDDRFDFHLVSGEVQDARGLSYIPGTYRAFGNNGTHALGGAINHPSNTAQPTQVLNALARVSDHLPVVADFRLPAVMQLSVAPVPVRVIRDATVPIDVQIWNAAQVTVPHGAANLEFSATGTGGLIGSASGTDPALGAQPQFTFQLDTSTIGQVQGGVVATTTSPQVPQAMITHQTLYNVIDTAYPSFHQAQQQLELGVDFGIRVPDGGTAIDLFGLFNQFQPFASSLLDLDSIVGTGDTDTLSISLQPLSGLVPGTLELFTIALDKSQSGVFSANWQLELSDENIPGETTHTMTISAMGRVALPGDANLDGVVDGTDFLIWNQHKFQSGGVWGNGDFNGDGVVDGADFLVWNMHKFQSLDAPPVAVPEPSHLWVFNLLFAWVLRTAGCGQRPAKIQL